MGKLTEMFYLYVIGDFIIRPPLGAISDPVPGETFGNVLNDQPPLALIEDQVSLELAALLPRVVRHLFIIIVVIVRIYSF